jgi:hypothetical protein
MSNEEAGLLVPYAIAGVDAMIYDRTIDGSGTRYPAFNSLSITPLTFGTLCAVRACETNWSRFLRLEMPITITGSCGAPENKYE